MELNNCFLRFAAVDRAGWKITDHPGTDEDWVGGAPCQSECGLIIPLTV